MVLAQQGLIRAGGLRRGRQGQALALHDAQQAVVQRRGADGLDQQCIKTHLAGGLAHAGVVVCGDQQAGRQAGAQQATQLAQGFDAVHRRHAPVNQQHVVGFATPQRLLHLGHRALTRGLQVHLQAQQLQPVAQDHPALGQVVHQQGAQALQ